MTRATLAVAAAALALLPAGCGGDDEQKTETAGGGQETAPRTETSSRDTDTSATRTATARTTPSSTDKGKSPEKQPGGAGDEVPARSLTQFTGRGGRITPKVVRVAPFISVRVELRSADGRHYGLRIGGKSLTAGGGVASQATTLDGLRAGRSYVGRAADGSTVQIEANAEPGP